MKKVLMILAIAAMLFPVSAMAMTPMTDGDLADVTGQAGVSINLHVNIDATIDVAAWGDTDGYGLVAGDEGWVGVTSLTITGLEIMPRQDWVQTGIGQYTNGITGANNKWQDLQFLTIDVGDYSGTTGVRIGLGTLEILMDEMAFDIALADSAANMDGNQEILGSVYVDDLDILLDKDNAVWIYPDPGENGVNIDFDMQLGMTAEALSFGDKDGLAADPAHGFGYLDDAGYVGLASLVASGITLDGKVRIDVATVDTAAATAINFSGTVPIDYLGVIYRYKIITQPEVGASFVAITLDSFQMGIADLTADVVLGPVGNLATGTALGSLYVNDVALNMSGFVHIFAH